MKGNERKKAFISFHFLFGIWTFQWVTADSNKKNFLSAQVRSKRITLSCGHTPPRRGHDAATGKGIA
jgi:hypothetical protein